MSANSVSSPSPRIKRRWQPGSLQLVSLLALLVACDAFRPPDSGDPGPSPLSSAITPANAAFSIVPPRPVITGPQPVLTVGSLPSAASATPPASNTFFTDVWAEQVVSPSRLSAKQLVLYSWTTDEQAAELKRQGPLLSRTERPGKGAGFAVSFIHNLAGTPDDTDGLAELLTAPEFSHVRYAWPNPWATRMGWPASATSEAEAYGRHLVRMVLDPESLLLLVRLGSDGKALLQVVDFAGKVIPSEQVRRDPTRLAGMYFERIAATGAASKCSAANGTFGGVYESADPYREFVVMNSSRVAAWSVDAPTEAQRLERDIEVLTTLRLNLPQQSVTAAGWIGRLGCLGFPGSGYEAAVALGNESYYPTGANIGALIATLQADLANWESLSGEVPSDAGAHVEPVLDAGVLPDVPSKDAAVDASP